MPVDLTQRRSSLAGVVLCAALTLLLVGARPLAAAPPAPTDGGPAGAQPPADAQPAAEQPAAPLDPISAVPAGFDDIVVIHDVYAQIGRLVADPTFAPGGALYEALGKSVEPGEAHPLDPAQRDLVLEQMRGVAGRVPDQIIFASHSELAPTTGKWMQGCLAGAMLYALKQQPHAAEGFDANEVAQQRKQLQKQALATAREVRVPEIILAAHFRNQEAADATFTMIQMWVGMLLRGKVQLFQYENELGVAFQANSFISDDFEGIARIALVDGGLVDEANSPEADLYIQALRQFTGEVWVRKRGQQLVLSTGRRIMPDTERLTSAGLGPVYRSGPDELAFVDTNLGSVGTLYTDWAKWFSQWEGTAFVTAGEQDPVAGAAIAYARKITIESHLYEDLTGRAAIRIWSGEGVNWQGVYTDRPAQTPLAKGALPELIPGDMPVHVLGAAGSIGPRIRWQLASMEVQFAALTQPHARRTDPDSADGGETALRILRPLLRTFEVHGEEAFAEGSAACMDVEGKAHRLRLQTMNNGELEQIELRDLHIPRAALMLPMESKDAASAFLSDFEASLRESIRQAASAAEVELTPDDLPALIEQEPGRRWDIRMPNPRPMLMAMVEAFGDPGDEKNIENLKLELDGEWQPNLLLTDSSVLVISTSNVLTDKIARGALTPPAIHDDTVMLSVISPSYWDQVAAATERLVVEAQRTSRESGEEPGDGKEAGQVIAFLAGISNFVGELRHEERLVAPGRSEITGHMRFYLDGKPAQAEMEAPAGAGQDG